MSGHRLVVWYNTRCPVCDTGIDWQRNKLLAAVRAGTLSFRDINEQPEALAAYGVSLDDVRRRLHATDQDDHLIVGDGCRDFDLAFNAGRGLAGDAVRQSTDAAGDAIWL